MSNDIKDTYEKPETVVPAETWVELCATLSNFVLEYSALDSLPMELVVQYLWTEDENGGEVYTEEAQDKFISVADEVENILAQSGLIKGEQP